jgi:hypothetical protein
VEDGFLGGLFLSTDGFLLSLLFSVFINALLNKISLISHINRLDEESSNGTPKDGSDGAAENAEWSNSGLEIFVGSTMSNFVVVVEFSWLGPFVENGTVWHESVVTRSDRFNVKTSIVFSSSRNCSSEYL